MRQAHRASKLGSERRRAGPADGRKHRKAQREQKAKRTASGSTANGHDGDTTDERAGTAKA